VALAVFPQSTGASIPETPPVEMVDAHLPEPAAVIQRRPLTPRLVTSLIAVIVGSLILRIAAQAMGQMLQFYFATIDRNYYHISFTIRGLVIASFFITELFGSPLLGALSDRFGRKSFIILGPLFGAIAVQMTSMTMVLGILVVTRLLEGLSTASSIPATLGYISEATTGRPNLRARVMGMFEITFVGGVAIGSFLSGYLWKFFGSPRALGPLPMIAPAFAVDGLVYLVSLAIFAIGLRDINARMLHRDDSVPPNFVLQRVTVHKPPAALARHYLDLVRSPRVWRFVPAWLAINSIIGLWLNHSVGLLSGKDHYNHQLLMGYFLPVKVGNGLALFATVFGCGVLMWSFVIGRYRKTSVMLVAAAGLFLTVLAVYSLNHLDTLSSPLFYPLLGSVLVGLFVMSAFTPAALTYLADVTESHAQDRGSIMGLYTVFLGIGQLIGTLIGGRFATWRGIDGVLILSALLGAITTMTLVQLHSRESLPVPEPPGPESDPESDT